VRDALVTYKLAGERRAAETFARWLTVPAAGQVKPDAICWVPSSRAALAMRGFDPAREIAEAFGRLVGMKARPLLRKIRETADQAGLGRAERAANLARAFDAPLRVPATVILVDDIMTTGATAGACARALAESGATLVQPLTVARAL
jgi:predicted amidophosphoribosyltransferase